jgi:hypothetical protein
MPGHDRAVFKLTENKTSVRTEVLAGVTTFLTMAYIIVVQPSVLSGKMFGSDTGLDFGAVTTATCLSAALATAIMALYARYPIAQLRCRERIQRPRSRDQLAHLPARDCACGVFRLCPKPNGLG